MYADRRQLAVAETVRARQADPRGRAPPFKPPWPDAKNRREFIQKCLGHSGLCGTSYEKYFRVLAECALQGKEEFPGRRVP